ncbi:MAG: hypothetical protein GXO47_12105 [Chlorobi bacterium]|nr:hypothetical protein [Chlorobiota bacterium]
MKLYLSLFLTFSFFLSAASQENITVKDTSEKCRFEPVTDTISSFSGTLFKDEFPVSIILKSDFTSFIKPKYDNQYLPAELIIKLPGNDSIVKNIRIKTRGKSRKDMCHFPPVKLNFKTDPIADPDYKGINKMKMVTHCKENSIFNKYILEEYLIYKMYNLITEYSFRVRLLRIEYKDTGKKKLGGKRYGFVIEPLPALAKRVNAVKVGTKSILYHEIDPLAADRVALFNYMIGNTDWQYKTSHNLKYIKILDVNIPGAYPIPYDFDYSGIINASYAVPQQWSYADNVQQRDYMGFCRESDAYFKVIQKEFLDAEEKIYDLINKFEPLSERDRKQMIWYIEEFYQELKYKNAFKLITSNCRDPF